MNDDPALLRCYVEEGSERAFATLVERHIHLVYAAALRRTRGNAHQAADIAQQVFTSLARHARRLAGHPALAAWLHTAPRNAALNLVKAEQRRPEREQAAAADPTNHATAGPGWEQVRPLLDQAIDQLGEMDRFAIVQRFLEQRDYAAIGAAFYVSADAARMRTERALEKLRHILRRHGVTSTTAALGVVLAQQALPVAPAGLAASISTTALASAPAGVAGFGTTILMSKLTTSATVAVLSVAATAAIWNAVTPPPGASELAALRGENARLLAATAIDASPSAVTATADEFDRQAAELARVIADRNARSRTAAKAAAPVASATRTSAQGSSSRSNPEADTMTSSGHRNHGQTTPTDAQLAFAWATDVADIDVLTRLLWFDGDGLTAAILDGMPASIRAEYPTPEALYALFLAAETQLGPPRGPEWFVRLEPVEIGPGRVGFRRPGATQADFWSFQQTDEGWKVVIPPKLVPIIARTVLSGDFMSQLTASQP